MIIFDVLTKTKNMEYQTGQAVITPKGIGRIININRRGSIRLHELLNEDILSWYFAEDISPATEAEILAEAVKHGWEIYVSGETIRIDSPSKELYFFKFFKSKNREFQIGGSYQIANVKDLSLFGQECIAAHRLITALNLTKPQQ